MEERSDRINSRLDDLAPAERDHVKRAIRRITAKSISRPVSKFSPEIERETERRVA